jgi:menaquinone-dependent protoporphyrinogen oxidase
MKVLVAYGSKYGATTEIAERIGTVLRETGLEVSVRPAESAGDVRGFDAVILGSAVYAGHWIKEAVEFLETNQEALSAHPVWFFSSGPTGNGDPVERMHGWRFPEPQQATADRIKPRGITLFHGKIDLNKMHFGERLIIRALGAPVGDFRDWNAITAWARGIATTLQPQPVAAGARLS